MTPIQIVVLRDKSDLRTDVFVETLQLAFEGSNASTEAPSSYLSDAVDLDIRVLDPSADIDDSEIASLLDGARHTIVVVVGDRSEQLRQFESNAGGDRLHVVDAEVPPPPRDPQVQEERGQLETAIAPVVTALQAMECARIALTNTRSDDAYSSNGGVLKLFIQSAVKPRHSWRGYKALTA